MAKKMKIHVGLEIGTSKTCMIVGEEKPDGGVKILGIGMTNSAGVRRGEVTDYAQAHSCLKFALSKAEEASDVEISSVLLSVTGAHFKSVNNRESFRLPNQDSTISADHLAEVNNLACDIHFPSDHVLLHSIIRKYHVDGLEHTSSPLGLFAKNLESELHIIHGIGTRIHNSIKLVRECPLEVDHVVFAPIATAQMALDVEQRQGGALLLDIGAGTTDYALYLESSIVASGCIPVGGDHITNDIHLVTGISFSKAEKLKILEGNASLDAKFQTGVAKLVDENGFADVEVKRELLNDIIHQRLKELFQLVKQELPAGSIESIGSGIYITGGTSLMNGISNVAFEVFGKDIYRPESSETIDHNHPSFKDPRCATAIGLIRYAQILDAEKTSQPSLFTKILKTFLPFGRKS